jgi:hypothetical protein
VFAVADRPATGGGGCELDMRDCGIITGVCCGSWGVGSSRFRGGRLFCRFCVETLLGEFLERTA